MSVEPAPGTGPRPPSPQLGLLPMIIFGSRWLQLPLYLGLIVAQCVYIALFLKELWHLFAMAIIGISSIALLRTFIEAGNLGSDRAGFTETAVMWQVLIHLTFVVSAIGIAYVDKLSESGMRKHAE
ncbi:putative membrane protein YqhA [Bradyrhizobium sp. USDA 326]|uniref:YqhA family protein n=1 Tax=unclassified Bradyrhizobium TaxID=2631580 RepID=UPI0035181CC6